VACIDNAKVISSYSGIIEAGKKLQQKESQIKAQSDTLVKEFETALKNFEKNKSKMTNPEILKTQDELKMMEDRYAHFNSINEEKFKKEQYSLTERAIEKINKIINKYAKEKGYIVVLGANNSGSVVYVDESIDITEDIIKILKQSGN